MPAAILLGLVALAACGALAAGLWGEWRTITNDYEHEGYEPEGYDLPGDYEDWT